MSKTTKKREFCIYHTCDHNFGCFPLGNDTCNQQQRNTMDIIAKNLIGNPNINLQTTYRRELIKIHCIEFRLRADCKRQSQLLYITGKYWILRTQDIMIKFLWDQYSWSFDIDMANSAIFSPNKHDCTLYM